MKKLTKITITTIIFILIIFLGSSFTQKKQEEDKNIQERIVTRDISFNNEKGEVIESINKREGKTSLVFETREGRKVIDEYLQNNEIPVKILEVFPFKTKKDTYLVAIVKSYVRVNNGIVNVDEFYDGIYIYNSRFNRKYFAEQKFYLDDNMNYYEFDLNNKNAILKKLRELEEEGLL